MRSRTLLCLGLLLVVAVVLGGCARTARDTTGFAITDSVTVDLPKTEAWQVTKAVLREKGFDLYTRDRRGVFVAFSKMRRRFFVAPYRTKYTVALESTSADATSITVETVKQVYGVTLLTYPAWHERKTTDHTHALALLDAIEAKASGGGASQETATEKS